MAIAEPERMECVPTSFVAMWSVSSPIAEMASRNAFEMCLDVMCSMQSYFQMAEIGVSSLAPGYNAAAARTGHSVMSPEAIWVVVLFFSSFFCILNVMLRQLEYSRLGSS